MQYMTEGRRRKEVDPHFQTHNEKFLKLTLLYVKHRLRNLQENMNYIDSSFQNDTTYLTDILMLDSTKVLCPLFDEIVILIPGDSLSISHLWTKYEILIRYRNEDK